MSIFDGMTVEARLEHLMNISEPFENAPTGNTSWHQHGYMILQRFLPEDLMAAYEDEWLKLRPRVIGAEDRWWGARNITSYLDFPEQMALCMYQPLTALLEELLGEPAGLNLVLDDWTSTRRTWHQDGYLSPNTLEDHYVSVWMALGSVNSFQGPFIYVPDSHTWLTLRYEDMLAILDPDEAADQDWPRIIEKHLTAPLERLIYDVKSAAPKIWLPERGDVLIWHPRLLHGGTVPDDGYEQRRSLIAQYSGINHRPDFPAPVEHNGGYYFPLPSTPY